MKTMKKNKFLQIGLIILSAICAFLCFGVMPLKQSVTHAAERAVVENVYIGDKIEAKDYKMSSAGADVYAEGMRIVYPSGGIYGSDKLVIEQAGIYDVTYYATVNGEHVEEARTYLAIRRPQDMIIADAGMTVEYGKFFVGESPYELSRETYGAVVHVKAGQKFTFATNIKTADLTSSFNFLEMIVQPSVYGETDFESITVRITDVGNENNYVEYIINSSNMVDGGGMVSYVKAGAANRMYGGYEGTRYHTGYYGAMVEHSFRGWGCMDGGNREGTRTVADYPLTLAIDNASKKVYCGPYSPTSSQNVMVNDLDDEKNYKSDPWEGFLSDEVSVTIQPNSFSKAEGVIMITSFAGYDFSKDIIDNKAPEIKFEYDVTDTLPVAETNTRFQILPFKAKDNLDNSVKTNVWVNYINENGKEITVENDGESFFVEYAGTYEIIYSAEDCSGNVAEERIQITAKKAAPSIYVGIEEAVVDKEIYDVVKLLDASAINVYGGSGNLKVERAVYSPSKKLLNVTDEVQLVELGDYKVVYTVTDYFGEVAYGVITIRANGISAPKFVEKPNFTDALVKDFTYQFPKAFVVETVGDKLISLTCKTYVNGEEKTGSFKAEGESVTIRYVAEGETGSIEWEETISVIDTAKGRYKSNYFYTEDALEIVDQTTSLEFVIGDDAKASFINSLNSQNFFLSFEYAAAKINFSEMSFIITDANNQDLSVTFYLFYNKADDTWLMKMNDGEEKFAYATSKGILSFTYAPGTKKIIDTSGEEIVAITSYDNGKAFNGFSEIVYFDIVFGGVESESSIALMQLCNQAMGYNKSSLDKAKDETKPIIVLDDVFLLRQKLGTKALIPTAKAYDVLTQIKEFTVTVELDGRLLASGKGDEAIDLMLDKAGYYSVTYYAEDTNGNDTTLPYMILVADETAPTLKVKDTLKNTYKPGDKVKIPTYSATDNGENCFIQVMVLLPDNELRLLHYSKNGEVTSLLDKENNIHDADFKAGKNTFIVSKKGKYVLRFVAFDDYYNYVVKEIVFWVK